MYILKGFYMVQVIAEQQATQYAIYTKFLWECCIYIVFDI